MPEIDFLYRKLKESKKYKFLCDDTLYRLARWASKRFQGKKAVKAAKNKLHQVYGAYFEKINPSAIQKRIDEISGNPDVGNIKTAAVEIMRSHTSTSERISFMPQLYPDLFKRTGKPKKVMDLACGLHPFALQWMDLEAGAEYYAFDIDTRLIAWINSFFSHLNGSYKAECADLLVTLPEIEADVVFLLKTLPCLEQQEKGVSEKIIKNLEAKHIVVSFPAKSLTGKAKGMEDYYHTFAKELFSRLNLSYFKLEYPNEVLYVVNG